MLARKACCTRVDGCGQLSRSLASAQETQQTGRQKELSSQFAEKKLVSCKRSYSMSLVLMIC